MTLTFSNKRIVGCLFLDFLLYSTAVFPVKRKRKRRIVGCQVCVRDPPQKIVKKSLFVSVWEYYYDTLPYIYIYIYKIIIYFFFFLMNNYIFFLLAYFLIFEIKSAFNLVNYLKVTYFLTTTRTRGTNCIYIYIYSANSTTEAGSDTFAFSLSFSLFLAS